MSLMISISGIRGIVGATLTPDQVVRYAAAFGEYCKKIDPENPTVILGRDGRVSGKIIGNLVSSTLLACGVNVRAIGICPTPTVGMGVRFLKATGGIAITASHNPVQWNGMKFIGSHGLFLDADENKDMLSLANRSGNVTFAPWDRTGSHESIPHMIESHIQSVLALEYLDVASIRRRKFKVVVDCINGSGGVIIPQLLSRLGCDVIAIHDDVSGVFAHTPEPLPENLGQLAQRVLDEKADLGIAVDPDADRLVLMTEEGQPFGEEYTVTAAVRFVLEKEREKKRTYSKSVVVNLSTTRAVEDVCSEFGVSLFRTPVGEINVAKKMLEVGALIGGEGSGGVILPAVHPGRDASVGVGLILQLLTDFGGRVSELRRSLPSYFIAKEKVTLAAEKVTTAFDSIISTLDGRERVNTDDGLRLDYPEFWVHMRTSNTEPIVRIIAEARTSEEATAIAQQFKRTVLAC